MELEQDRHRRFIIDTPLPEQRHFRNPAWRFATGEERNRAGRTSFCDSILDFLFWNLGPVESKRPSHSEIEAEGLRSVLGQTKRPVPKLLSLGG